MLRAFFDEALDVFAELPLTVGFRASRTIQRGFHLQTASKAAPLIIDRVGKRYGDFTAVDEVSLTIAPGQFLTLLGPSGSGKTTLLMMIAGFVQPTSGHIRLGDADITDLPPEKRDFGMVFQGYALFPTMTVRDNVGFPLRLRGRSRGEIYREVDRMLELVELKGLGGRMPRQLSGGQQQRVALARALIFNPKLLLLDEPLSALDKKLRAGLQEELRALHQQLGTTFIFVTHDQDEALSMSDEIAIVNHGRIVQRGSPADLYERPASHFVADFLGRSNFVAGVAVAAAEGVLSYDTPAGQLRQRLGSGSPPAKGAHILVALRPEKITMSASKPVETRIAVAGVVQSSTYLGADQSIVVETALGRVQVVTPTWRSAITPTPGLAVWLTWDDDASVLLTDERSSS